MKLHQYEKAENVLVHALDSDSQGILCMDNKGANLEWNCVELE